MLSHNGDEGSAPSSPLYAVTGMVVESIGPMRHEVSVPFHDSQAKRKALLIQTGWDRRWGTESYWEPCPFLAEDLIFKMVRSGVVVVGVDFWITGRSDATQLILGGKLPIVENLRDLSSLPRWGFQFTVLPLSGSAGAAQPVCVFAETKA